MLHLKMGAYVDIQIGPRPVLESVHDSFGQIQVKLYETT